jgi:acyl-CoA synthetase (AMP-forming)/AMP-acid ligase II
VERYNYCIANARPAMWVWLKGSKMKWLQHIFPAIKAIPRKVEVDPTGSGSDDNLLLPEDVVLVMDALISFTTGSTGMPKLLLRQHSFVLKQSKCLSNSSNMSIKPLVDKEEKDTSFCTNLVLFPLHFLKVGATSMLCPNFTKCDPAKVISTLRKYNITVLGGSPAFVHRIAQYANSHRISLPVAVTLVGGAPIFRGMLRAIANVTPNKNTIVLYGSTEVEPVSFIMANEKLSLEEDKPVGLCVGKPVVEGSVKIIKISQEVLHGRDVDMADYEVNDGEIGEVLVSGWHVNTDEAGEERLIKDLEGKVWLRIEDAGYMDRDGRIWLVGRVKWRVVDGKTGKTYWSTDVEQKILERTSKITFVSYLNHNGQSYLFIEAPDGLPSQEHQALESFIKAESIPVDNMIIKSFIPKDRRHSSKPNTAALFGGSNTLHQALALIKYIIINNPVVLLIFIVFLCLAMFYFIF